MPQLQLPLFPHGSVHLTPDLAVLRQDDTVTYVHGSLPVFQHRAADVKSFRLITSQLYLNGRGVPKDYVRAYTWASIARGTRDDQDEKLKSLASRMTPTEITDAQQRIAAWWSRRVPTSGSR